MLKNLHPYESVSSSSLVIKNNTTNIYTAGFLKSKKGSWFTPCHVEQGPLLHPERPCVFEMKGKAQFQNKSALERKDL